MNGKALNLCPEYLAIVNTDHFTNHKSEKNNAIDMNLLQILAICGMTSPIIYTLMWILGGFLRSDYSRIRDDIISLFAVGAPRRKIFNAFIIASSLLLFIFYLGLHWGINNGQGSIIGSLIFVISGLLGVLVAFFFPLDAELKNDFVKISEVLRLSPKSIPQAEDKIKNLEKAIGQLENENIAFKTRIDLLQKDFRKLKETVEKLYPRHVKRHIVNEDGKVEEYVETFANPEDYLEDERKFMQEVLLKGKSKKYRERLKNTMFVLDKAGKMPKEDIEAEFQRLQKKKTKE